MKVLNWLICTSLLAGGSTSIVAESKARGIFLNGVDISSARHQTLENVTIRIDGQGHLYIEAPHYEVNEESTYIPLSSWNRQDGTMPQHKAPSNLPRESNSEKELRSLPTVARQAKPVRAAANDSMESPNAPTIPAGEIPNSPARDPRGQPTK